MKKISILTLASVMMFNGVVKADVDTALDDLTRKKQVVQNACLGIKKSLDTIFGLSVATTVSSGLGTAVAGGALATGIAKDVIKDKKNMESTVSFNSWKETLKEVRSYFGLDSGIKGDYYSNKELLVIAEKTRELASRVHKEYSELNRILGYKNIIKEEDKYNNENKSNDDLTESLKSRFTHAEMANTLAAVLDDLNNIDEETYKKGIENQSKTLGNVRTGLMAGATATSAVSMGTSLGATLTARELAEKMVACNGAILNLKMAISVAEAEEVEADKLVKAREITSACTGFDMDNIKTLKTTMTASAIVSGIGTYSSTAGTVTSILANSEKVRGDNSDKGKKKEKNFNLISNIMAGVTAGTSGASTVLSATAIKKAKQDSEMAERCEAVLAQ